MERSISQLEQLDPEEGLRGHRPELEFIDDEEDNSETEDALELNNEDTASEQSYDEMPDVDENEIQEDSQPFIRSNDGTKWNLHAPRQVPRLNTILRRGKINENVTSDARTVLGAWKLFITDQIIENITTYTNEKIQEFRGAYGRPEQANYMSSMEIRALIGLLYLTGLYRTAQTNIADIWSNDGCGIELCRLTLPEYRVRFLLRALHFDELNTREERRRLDKMTAFRQFHDLFVENCKRNYVLGDFVTVDEMLIGFRGRCGFRQYMGKKPAKYGLKVYAAVDSRSFYTYNLEPYCGVQPPGPFRKSNTPTEVVKRLIQPIFGEPRTIVTDNYFTSFRLGQELKNENMNLVGKVNKNRVFVPRLMTMRRPLETSFFAFNDVGTLVTYSKTAKKFVLLFSTMDIHKSDLITPNDEKNRPEINILYNKTKSGVDHVDQLISNYSVSRNSRRWPLTLFFAYLDIAAVNGYIAYKEVTNNTTLQRKDYIKQLSINLIEDQARNRLRIRQTPLQVKRRLVEMFPDEQAQDIRPEAAIAEEEERCYLCPSRLNRKSKTRCVNCLEHICKTSHTVPLCTRCMPSQADA